MKPEGRYRELVLEGVKARVLEGIEKRSRRRKWTVAGVVAAIVIGAIASGSALTATARDEPTPVVTSVPDSSEHGVTCIDGSSVTKEPYFSLRFTFHGDGDFQDQLDPIQTCRDAWMQAGEREKAISDGEAYLAWFQLFVGNHFSPSSFTWLQGGGNPAPEKIGTVPPQMAICQRPLDKAIYVISPDAGETQVSVDDWTVRCRAQFDYDYIENWGDRE